ncbi:MAG: LacI family DNA-binding transcriptional regulator [Bacilli bacterium]
MKGDNKYSSQIKIYDVAGAAGVSLATVSRVLNHPEKVKPGTREKINKIIRELGYKPNLNAKGLASSKSTTVAVVVPELTRSSIAGMVDGIADCANRRGYLLRLFVNRPMQENENVKEHEKELWGLIMSSSVDGVLYINDEISDEQLEIMKEQNTSLVLTNTVCSDKDIPSVSIDYFKAAYDITKEMIRRGNKNIWIVTTIRKYVVNDLKVDGYSTAMQEEGLTPYVVKVSGKTELNQPAFEEELKNGYPDVAIVVRDSMAVSFINVARKLKIQVPDDMQVIGFQNTKYAELSRPTLTCINTPIYELGEAAMDLLTDFMEERVSDENPINQLINFDIVWRDSTKNN